MYLHDWLGSLIQLNSYLHHWIDEIRIASASGVWDPNGPQLCWGKNFWCHSVMVLNMYHLNYANLPKNKQSCWGKNFRPSTPLAYTLRLCGTIYPNLTDSVRLD